MKRIKIFLVALLGLCSFHAYAQDYPWPEPGYMFIVYPASVRDDGNRYGDIVLRCKILNLQKITYSDDGTKAYLFMKRYKTPYSFKLTGANPLQIQYEKYLPLGIKEIQTQNEQKTMSDGRKFFSGRKLMIVKDGKFYNINGTQSE